VIGSSSKLRELYAGLPKDMNVRSIIIEMMSNSNIIAQL
jgi:hypothetical protein